MLTLDKVYHAKYVLKPVIRETDVIHAPKINPEAQIVLKTENLQITGSFKVRGAYYKMSCLSDEEKSKGVIACSAGNHAQGVALAAKKNGIRAVICLPDGAPISKVEATKSYGGDIGFVPILNNYLLLPVLFLRSSCFLGRVGSFVRSSGFFSIFITFRIGGNGCHARKCKHQSSNRCRPPEWFTHYLLSLL